MTREPIKLLLVEDEQAHAELIEKAVASSDLNPTLTHVSSGDEALSTLQEESFDLVLLDYSLPGQDGLELLPQIIAMGCAVIMITGHGNEEVAVKAMKQGAVDYLVKSSETFDLLPAIIERSLKTLEAEEALRVSEARSRALLDGSPVCNKIISLDSRLQFMSAAGIKALGITDIKPYYRQPFPCDFYPESARNLLAEHLERAKAGEVVSLEAPALDTEGRELWFHTTFVPVRDAEGKVEYIISTSIDTTERKRAEEELRNAHEELKQSYDAMERAQKQLVLSEKLAAVGRLTAGVSHEILNPLNIITMSLDLMIQDPDAHPPNADQLRILQEQADRIAKITQSLLYVASQRQPERRLLDMNHTVQRTLGLLERGFELDNIDVELKLAEALPSVLADEDQLQQVVLNLLNNARDAMPEGGRLTLKSGAVQDDGRRFFELRVEDTGPGIDPEHLDRLFDPFFTTKDEGEGTGLGLSICYGIIEAHGGTIRAENVPGGGAAFTIRLGVENG